MSAMKTKIALITGANSGIGLETAKALAKDNFDLILITRSVQKGEATTKEIKEANAACTVYNYTADLMDFPSVQSAAASIGKAHPVIDRIVCNAGYGPDKVEFTADGYEQSFAANHLGHFVLVQGLIPNVEASEDGRIINVSSAAHMLGKFERFFKKNNSSMNALQAYADGKLANIIFTKALTKRLKRATAYSLHPGVIKSNFGSNYTGVFKFLARAMRPFMITTVQGAATTIYLATAPLNELKNHNGSYFVKSKAAPLKHKDVTDENAEHLWVRSAEAVGV